MLKVEKKSRSKDFESCNMCTRRDYDDVYEIYSTDEHRHLRLVFCEKCLMEMDSIVNFFKLKGEK